MRKWHNALLLGTLLALPGLRPAAAQGFDVRPVIIETKDGTASVAVGNSGDRRLYIETQMLDWRRDASGHDVLTESREAVASPPGTYVQPGSSYTIRLAAPPVAGGGREHTYRLQIQQVPEASDLVGGRVVIAVTQSLPVFVQPPDLTPMDLSARLVGGNHLLIHNAGGRRARIGSVTQDGRKLADGLLGYALGGQDLDLMVPGGLHAGTVELGTDLGPRLVQVR